MATLHHRAKRARIGRGRRRTAEEKRDLRFLNSDVWEYIFTLVTNIDRFRMISVCKLFHQVLANPSSWLWDDALDFEDKMLRTPIPCKALSRLKDLIVVLVGDRRFGDEYLHVITSFRSLTQLDLRFCHKFTPDGFASSIGRLKSLRSLNLRGSGSWVTDECLAATSALTSLTSLNLDRCNRITDAGLQSLSNLTNLTTLDLSRCHHFTNAGLDLISASMSNLLRLDLAGCRGVRNVNFLRSLSSLTTLNISGCNVAADDFIVAIMENITSRNTTFTFYLDISNCEWVTETLLQILQDFDNLDIRHTLGYRVVNYRSW